MYNVAHEYQQFFGYNNANTTSQRKPTKTTVHNKYHGRTPNRMSTVRSTLIDGLRHKQNL